MYFALKFGKFYGIAFLKNISSFWKLDGILTLNAKILKLDRLKQRLIILIATMQISVECETQES